MPPTSPEPGPPAPVRLSQLSWAPHEVFLGPITVSWDQSAPATVVVEYQVDGAWQQTPAFEGEAGPNETTVIGIPLGEAAPYRVSLVDDEVTLDAKTPIEALPVPETLILPAIDVSDPKRWEESGSHVFVPVTDFTGAFWVTIYDRSGRPVWAHDGGFVLSAQRSAAGNGVLWADFFTETATRTYLDKPIDIVAIPGHVHVMRELPDGTIAWYDGPIGEPGALMEWTPGGTAPTAVWSGQGWPMTIPPDAPMPFTPYINGLSYDPDLDHYVLSDFITDSVVTVSRTTGDAQWWTTPQRPGFSAPGGYDFVPVESSFVLQHGVEVLTDGNLLAATVRDGTVAAVEYEVDRANAVLREVWRFDSGLPDANYSWVDRLPSGNTLLVVAFNKVLYEVTPAGDVAWRADFGEVPFLIGRSFVIEDLYALLAP